MRISDWSSDVCSSYLCRRCSRDEGGPEEGVDRGLGDQAVDDQTITVRRQYELGIATIAAQQERPGLAADRIATPSVVPQTDRGGSTRRWRARPHEHGKRVVEGEGEQEGDEPGGA